MKHAIIVAHPNADGFTPSMARAYAHACTQMGHAVIARDLYRIAFDPCLHPDELPFAKDFRTRPDVLTERMLLRDCDVFAFFYPLWLNAPPAILKGYMERVFGFGFAYGAQGRSHVPLLGGKTMISFTSSGAPTQWIRETGSLGAIHTLFDDYFASQCGMRVADHIHTGEVVPGASAYFVQAQLRRAEEAARTHFGSTE